MEKTNMRQRSLNLGIIVLLLLQVLALGVIIRPFAAPREASAAPAASGSFERTWARTDQPVATGQVNRTWMWGQQANSGTLTEPYTEAPGGQRTVQYFDKSRMEDNSYNTTVAPWDVTNGLLVVEMVDGRYQTGDATFDESPAPAAVNIAGDPGEHPTYADINTFGLRGKPATAVGSTLTTWVDASGIVASGTTPPATVTAAERPTVAGIDHTVASVFWEFMNSSGLVYENDQTIQASLFQNPYYATGYPITEAYWSAVKIGGTPQTVLWQCFERRCLTYNPLNGPGWQVEAGNVGQHYYAWRGGLGPSDPNIIIQAVRSAVETRVTKGAPTDIPAGDSVIMDEITVDSTHTWAVAYAHLASADGSPRATHGTPLIARLVANDWSIYLPSDDAFLSLVAQTPITILPEEIKSWYLGYTADANVTASAWETTLASVASVKLPFPAGNEYIVKQLPGGGFSHGGFGSEAYDFAMPLGSTVVAAQGGTITLVEDSYPLIAPKGANCNKSEVSRGNRVVISHDTLGYSTLYLHLQQDSVLSNPSTGKDWAPGDRVNQGQPIALSGDTGWSCGPHLHFQVQDNCGVWWCQSRSVSFTDAPQGLTIDRLAKSGNTPPASVYSPNAPTNLRAEGISTTEIKLTWDDKSDNEKGFKIYGSAGTYIGQVGAGKTTYTVTGLKPSEKHCYQVTAWNDAGESAKSNVACATTKSAGPACSSTSGYWDVYPYEAYPGDWVTLAGDGTQINGGWYEGLRVDFYLYDVYEREFYLGFGIVECDGSRPVVAISVLLSEGISPGTACIYSVHDGKWTGCMFIEILSRNTKPATPSGLYIGYDGNQEYYFLGWQDNATNETTYEVWAGTYASGYIDTYLGDSGQNGWFYWLNWEYDITFDCYAVRAYNDAGYSEWSNQACWGSETAATTLTPDLEHVQTIEGNLQISELTRGQHAHAYEVNTPGD